MLFLRLFVVIYFLLMASETTSMDENVRILDPCLGADVVLQCKDGDFNYKEMKIFCGRRSDGKKPALVKLPNGTNMLVNVSLSVKGLICRYSCKRGSKKCLPDICKVMINPRNNCKTATVSEFEGSNITLYCDISTTSPIVIKWYKMIPNSTGALLLGTNNTTEAIDTYGKRLSVDWKMLKITDALQADGGRYYCIARRPKVLSYTYILKVAPAFRNTSRGPAAACTTLPASTTMTSTMTTMHPNPTATQLSTLTTPVKTLTMPKSSTMDSLPTPTLNAISITTNAPNVSGVNVKVFSGCCKPEGKWAMILLIVFAILLEL